MNGRLPLHVLTGFLGSGKTTLLNRLLRDPALADSAVLINEIGAVAIDHHLVQRIEGSEDVDIVVLKGGCTCCMVRGDLAEALRELYDRRAQGGLPAFSRAILETSGLADPGPVLFTLAADRVLRHKFAAGTVIATIDAVHAARQLQRYPETRRQLAAADHVVITKSDLADPPAIAALAAELTRMNPAATVRDIHGLGELAPLLTTPDLPAPPAGQANTIGSPAQNTGKHGDVLVHEAEHSEDVAAFALTLDEPVEWAPFSTWLSLLLHAHAERILRFKALLDVAGWSAPVMLDGIHHLLHPPIHLTGWPDGPRVSRIVLIGQNISMARVEASLRGFLARY